MESVEPMPGRPIKSLTEWFDELNLEDKLMLHKKMIKIDNKRAKKHHLEINEQMLSRITKSIGRTREN